jgi:UDP-2-acetamido-2,6-beta-L-arabino-hexul-4-ose reductase
MNKILVTGSNGFIGKHMTKALRRAGYEVLEYDLDKTEADLKHFVNEADFVVHLAGINRPLSVEEFYDGNTNFTKKLVDFLKISGKNTPIIMSSSTQAALDNDYGKSKKMGEDYLFASELPVYVFRLANVFGKWCRPNYNSAAATFMYNIAHNLPIEIRDPNYVVHYNYVDDIVNTFSKCITGEIAASKEILSVLPIHDCSLGNLASLLKKFKSTVESDEHLPDINSEFEYKLFISFLDYLKDDSYSYNFAEDARGSFEELYKNEKYGQISVNKSFPGIVKGGHYHTYKNEIFMTVEGDCVTRLRKIGSKEIVSYSQPAFKSVKVKISPYHTHDIKNVGNVNSATLMWISEVYSDQTPDTFIENVDIE